VANDDRGGNDVRISDPEPKFTYQICSDRGADIRRF